MNNNIILNTIKAAVLIATNDREQAMGLLSTLARDTARAIGNPISWEAAKTVGKVTLKVALNHSEAAAAGVFAIGVGA